MLIPLLLDIAEELGLMLLNDDILVLDDIIDELIDIPKELIGLLISIPAAIDELVRVSWPKDESVELDMPVELDVKVPPGWSWPNGFCNRRICRRWVRRTGRE